MISGILKKAKDTFALGTKYRDIVGFAYDLAALRPGYSQIVNTLQYLKFFIGNEHDRTLVGHYPVSFGVFITLRCNLNCQSCYFDWKNQDILKDDMSVEEFKTILNLPVFSRAIRINLAGGEVLIHPDLIEFIDIVHSKHLYSIIYSNGLLLHKCYKDISKSGLNSISVSVYDQFIDKQIDNLAILIDENKRINNKMVISLSRIVSDDNYHSMETIINLAKRIGIKNIFFQNHYTCEPEPVKGIYQDNKEYLLFLSHIEKQAKNYKLNVIFPPLLPRHDTGLMCISLYSSFSVNRRGDMSPCCFIVPPAKIYGNVFTDKNPWNSYFSTYLRQTFIDHTMAKHPKCKNCSLKTIKSFGMVKFF
ncbi:MAG: radical SAM protein [Nitrospirae bacterium]|nr:radical SAM protein [Nitrospirota bacterium]